MPPKLIKANTRGHKILSRSACSSKSKAAGPACFLDFRFYLARKTIEAEKNNAKIKGAVVPFQTKLQLAGQMLINIGHYFPTSPLLAVTDSWFGNQSLWRQVRKVLGDRFHMLSRFALQ